MGALRKLECGVESVTSVAVKVRQGLEQTSSSSNASAGFSIKHLQCV
jgi:hypothetical protein